MSRRSKRLVLALLTLLVALGAAEIFLRIAWRRVKKPEVHSWHEFDAKLGWRHKKSYFDEATVPVSSTATVTFKVRTNAQGLRVGTDEAFHDMAPVASPG